MHIVQMNEKKRNLMWFFMSELLWHFSVVVMRTRRRNEHWTRLMKIIKNNFCHWKNEFYAPCKCVYVWTSHGWWMRWHGKIVLKQVAMNFYWRYRVKGWMS